jgi:hypothetical protein
LKCTETAGFRFGVVRRSKPANGSEVSVCTMVGRMSVRFVRPRPTVVVGESTWIGAQKIGPDPSSPARRFATQSSAVRSLSNSATSVVSTAVPRSSSS